MRCGSEQTILHVDLSTGRLRREVIPEPVVRAYLGGRGIGDWLLWRDLKPGADPLGPENVLVFSTGVLLGTSAPTAGRSTILCVPGRGQLRLGTRVDSPARPGGLVQTFSRIPWRTISTAMARRGT